MNLLKPPLINSRNAEIAAIVTLIFIMGLPVALAPMPVLLSFFLQDDAFYYFKTAWNFALTGFSSFDGIHATNGYHPLWFLFCVPPFWFFPHGGDGPIRLLLFLQLIFFTCGVVAIFLALRRLYDPFSALMAVIIIIFYGLRTSLNGLETSLLLLVLGVTIVFFVHSFVLAESQPSRVCFAVFGGLCALNFLARTDSVFLIAMILLYLAFRPPRDRQQKVNLASFAIPAGLMIGLYFAINRIYMGHLMPVSGAAKLYYAGLLIDIDAKGIGPVRARIDNLLWTFSSYGSGILRFSLVIPMLVFFASFAFKSFEPLRLTRKLWPFYGYTLLVYLFYGIFFHGTFTRTTYYYLPNVVIASVAVAAISHIWNQSRIGRYLPNLAAVPITACSVYGLRAICFPVAGGLLLFGLGLLLAKYIERRFRAKSPLKITILILYSALALCLSKHWIMRDSPIYTWIVVLSFLVLLFQAAVMINLFSLKQASISALFILLLFTIPAAKSLHEIVRESPKGWNYNLYLGALWAGDHLPQGATVWSGSTGILGYYSGRTCVNTDGLINDYDFLNNYLKKGRLAEYVRQWDYTIDAYYEDGLDYSSDFSIGELVPIPEEITKFPFNDYGRIRRLKVYATKKI